MDCNSSSRGKAITEAEKKKKDQRKLKNQHIFRVAAQVRQDGVTERTPSVRVILSDFSGTGVAFLASSALAEGQRIVLLLEAPEKLYVKGTVIAVEKATSGSKIVSEIDFPFRTHIKFYFDSTQELEEIKGFCERIGRRLGEGNGT